MTKQEEIREHLIELFEQTPMEEEPKRLADAVLWVLNEDDVVIKVDRELPVEDNNMGNMSKAEVIDFFTYVTDDLGVVIVLEFTPTSPSIYLKKAPKILFCENDLNGYKWQVKERILHEIAHHFEVGKRRHASNFYKVYMELVSKYLAGFVVEPLIGGK